MRRASVVQRRSTTIKSGTAFAVPAGPSTPRIILHYVVSSVSLCIILHHPASTCIIQHHPTINCSTTILRTVCCDSLSLLHNFHFPLSFSLTSYCSFIPFLSLLLFAVFVQLWRPPVCSSQHEPHSALLHLHI